MLKLKLNLSSGIAIGQLELPAPLDELKQRINEMHVADQTNTAPAVLNADGPVSALNWHLWGIRLDNDATLQKLNQLAEVIDGMDAAGRYHLSKSLNQEIQQELDDVLRLAAHIKTSSLDCYEVIPGVTSHQELGKWLVEHDRLEDRVPEALRPYLDYRSIGIDYCNSHEGEFLSGGYTGVRSGAMEQVMEEYGKQVLRRTGADDEAIDTIDGYMNFTQLGEDSMAEDGVRRTEFGLVRRLSKPFPPEPEIGQTMM